MKIGIFGGTFNPPHEGHIAIAEQARKQLGLDFIYFVPAYIPPHKQNRLAATATHRMKMLKLSVEGKEDFKVSTIELKRRGISYTVDTLKSFKKRFPKAELVLIIGADNFMQFNSWKSPKTILRLASLAVYKRKGFHLSPKEKAIDFTLLKGRMLSLSSTEIRNKIEMGLSLRGLVRDSIIFYIKQHCLYSKQTHISHRRLFHENHRVS